MEYYIVLGVCLIVIFIVKIVFGINKNAINKVKSIGYDKTLNDITNKFPENKEVCKDILKSLNNENVEIVEANEENRTLTYYSAVSNRITIANIKDTFTRIQTIAHECLHSVQNRKMLLFNFIFSNIYILYFFVISILTIFKLIKMPMLQAVILSIMGIVYYSVRTYLETDAMTKAPYLAKDYMESKNILSKEELNKVIENYNKMNEIGIPMTNFQILIKVITKIIIYSIIAIIVTM